jgi:hypothetical protein
MAMSQGQTKCHFFLFYKIKEQEVRTGLAWADCYQWKERESAESMEG